MDPMGEYLDEPDEAPPPRPSARRHVLITAVLTGLFCAIFTIAVDLITDIVSMRTAILLSFFSGFAGSVFAHFVLGRSQR